MPHIGILAAEKLRPRTRVRRSITANRKSRLSMDHLDKLPVMPALRRYATQISAFLATNRWTL